MNDYLALMVSCLAWTALGGFKAYFWIQLLGLDVPTCKKDYHKIIVIGVVSLIFAPVMLLILVVLLCVMLWSLLKDAYKDYKELPYE